jgi:hypothetical protein
MQFGRGRALTNVIAVLVIIALLSLVGIPFGLIFLTGTFATIVWLVADRTRQRETEKIFLFYVAADSILREAERRWYGFEIQETIDRGEELLGRIPDSPPLQFFALGALHFKLGNHAIAAEYLAKVLEDESLDEGQRRGASPQLRRYVKLLRHIEAEPASAPQTLGAIRNLERLRGKKAVQMLTESRAAVGLVAAAATQANGSFATNLPMGAITTPPSISEVLHNVYEEED